MTPKLHIKKPLPKKRFNVFSKILRIKAGDEARTHNLDLGKVALCQLSYARNNIKVQNNFIFQKYVKRQNEFFLKKFYRLDELFRNAIVH